MASGEAPPEPLQSKTVVLRVSIHCEGCKKKVKKVLKSIPGVFDCDVDARQNKVTVTLQGNVDAGILVKKLLKSNKQAELWPLEKKNKPANQNPGANSGNKEKQNKEPKEPPESSEKKPSDAPVAAKPTDANANANAKANASGDATKAPEADAKSAETSLKPTVEQKTSTKENDSKATQKSAENSNPPPEIPKVDDTKKAGAPAPKEESNGSGDSEKGKSEQKEKTKERKVDVEQAHEPHNMYPSPMHPYPQPPAYVMSYNMVQPSTSRALYATAPMPPASQGYMHSPYPPSQEYMYTPYAPPPPPEYYYYGPPSEPPQQDSYDMFNDENANSCSIM
ncbi:uncharacterized protein [Typha angustifolia]|uniref:uncharacterized protein n=1 Tax=Typha angustifolia TaxID=59011 RepID=UPI003C2DA8DD